MIENDSFYSSIKGSLHLSLFGLWQTSTLTMFSKDSIMSFFDYGMVRAGHGKLDGGRDKHISVRMVHDFSWVSLHVHVVSHNDVQLYDEKDPDFHPGWSSSSCAESNCR